MPMGFEVTDAMKKYNAKVPQKVPLDYLVHGNYF